MKTLTLMCTSVGVLSVLVAPVPSSAEYQHKADLQSDCRIIFIKRDRGRGILELCHRDWLVTSSRLVVFIIVQRDLIHSVRGTIKNLLVSQIIDKLRIEEHEAEVLVVTN